MSSLLSMVQADGPLKMGVSPGPDVRALQMALSQAGYRVDITPDQKFTDDTDYWLRQFQRQHGLTPDGVLGGATAGRLDQPHAHLVAVAKPMFKSVQAASQTGAQVSLSMPHDDTASLIAFYGRPWEDSSLIVRVPVPFPMTYKEDDGRLLTITSIPFHKKVAANLAQALNEIAETAKADPTVLRHVTHWSGSYNYRPVRGSSRLSTHAFAAANDFDAEHLPLGHGVPATEMPQPIVDIFKNGGFFWGGDYIGRKDAMHFQAAHE